MRGLAAGSGAAGRTLIPGTKTLCPADWTTPEGALQFALLRSGTRIPRNFREILVPERQRGVQISGNRPSPATLRLGMGSLIKKRRKRMRKKKHKKMLKATRWQRRAGK